MNKGREALKHKIFQVWMRTKKDLESALDETAKLLKSGEKHLKVISDKSREKLELMNLKIKRENLCHKLGKAAALTQKSKWAESKKIDKLFQDIKKLDKEIKKLQ